jgi:pilus assembly protein TadC
VDVWYITIVFLSLVAFAGVGSLIYMFRGEILGQETSIRGLMSSNADEGFKSKHRKSDDSILDPEEIKRRTKSGVSTGKKIVQQDLNSKLFRAGYYSTRERSSFKTKQIIAPFLFASFGFLIGFWFIQNNVPLLVSFGILGGFVGYTLPLSILERKIRKRQELVLYYLPLVIEQISIGVSSALDIGPCISNILKMASDRDAHNPVTEMFIHVEKLIRSGLNLEDALVEVAEAYAMQEVKHAFLFLGQCAKHGGELSKQLQELADAVATQRQTVVEAKIAALPVKATGPLAMVFAGFFAMLLSGLVTKISGAFGNHLGQ